MSRPARSTVAALLAAGARVFWACHECRATGPADLARISAERGPDLDLTNRTPPCRTPGCGYWVNFYAQDGQRTWPLRTEAGLMAEGDRRTAWLACRPPERKKAPAARTGGA